jgi:uncharacterized repeat protein (TIGR01451 family)
MICLSISMQPRVCAYPDPLNVSWYVTDASNAPIDGASLTIHWATSASGPFTAMPSSIVQDKIADAFQNPITTGYWNPAHPHGMALADLHITSVSSYYFYAEVQYGTYVWYWPIASSYKPGDSTWQPVAASGSPSSCAASGNGFGNGPSTAFPTQQPPVLHPGISVTKSGPAYAHEGDTIAYTIIVTNPSSTTTMYKDSVVDSVLGDLSGYFSNSLAPGLSETKTFTYTVPSPQILDVTNTVTVTYEDTSGSKKTAPASWIVDVLHPAIDVAKSGPTDAHEGDLITYAITVINMGDCPLVGVSVSDPTLSFSWTGDLDTGATATFYPSYMIPHLSTLISNTATASGSDVLGGFKGTVSDSSSCSVTVLHPGISVSKTGPASAHEGDTVTYTYIVTNGGDCSLKLVSVADDKAGSATYVGGDANGNGWLDLTETWTFKATYLVPTPSGDIINTATASGTDSFGETVANTATWSVDVLHPGIHVTKMADKTVVHQGDTITYTITVTNTGDCPLSGVSMTDTLLGSLTGHLPDTTLGVGEVDTFTVDYVVPAYSTLISNTVTASGSDPLSKSVSNSASSAVTVAPPPSVGGEWAPIMLQILSPVNTLRLLALWTALASMTVIAMLFVVITRFKKRARS